MGMPGTDEEVTKAATPPVADTAVPEEVVIEVEIPEASLLSPTTTETPKE